MKMKEESEKAGKWKAQHSENQDMASSPITSWQIDGETVMYFIFLVSKITVTVTAVTTLKDACSLEEKL